MINVSVVPANIGKPGALKLKSHTSGGDFNFSLEYFVSYDRVGIACIRLGYVIGPGTSWALDNLRQVAQDRMNELRKGVVPCAVDLKIASSGVTALKCGGPVGAWTVDFEARLAGGAVVGSAIATFTLAFSERGSYPVTVGVYCANGTPGWLASPVDFVTTTPSPSNTVAWVIAGRQGCR